MSTELLRRAAAKMRERAEAATPGPWESDLHEVSQHWSCPEPWAIVASNEIDCLSYCYGGSARGIEEPADAEHIASWHPAVALAVAKAMDDVALAWEIADEANDGYVYDLDNDSIPFEDTVDAGWVAVARAYLGSDA